jgi:hypothetical protein
VAWIGHAITLPETVGASLEVLFEGPVHHVQVFEHSLFVRLHGRAVATTRRGRIYLRGSGSEFFENPWLMLHEYCQVIKQWEPGRSRFAATQRSVFDAGIGTIGLRWRHGRSRMRMRIVCGRC